MLLHSSVETLCAAVGLRFGKESVVQRYAQEFGLIAEVIRRVWRGVIHSQRQSMARIGFARIEVFTQPLADGVQSFESLVTHLGDVNAAAHRVIMIDCGEDLGQSFIDRLDLGSISTPYFIGSIGRDAAIVEIGRSGRLPVGRKHAIFQYEPRSLDTGHAGVVLDTQAPLDLVRALADERRASQIGTDGSEQCVVRYFGLRPPSDRGKQGDVAERPGALGIDCRAREVEHLVYPFQFEGFTYRGDCVAHVHDLRAIKGRRSSRSRSMRSISISISRARTRCTASLSLTSNLSVRLEFRLASMPAKVSSRDCSSLASVTLPSRKTALMDSPRSRRRTTARFSPPTDHLLNSAAQAASTVALRATSYRSTFFNISDSSSDDAFIQNLSLEKSEPPQRKVSVKCQM